jgi:steroid delta-isomerase-like uncharacterized protein
MDNQNEIGENKDLVRRFVEEVFVRRDPAAVEDLVADDFQSHTWPSAGDAKASLRDATARMADALDDVSFSVEDLIAEDDRVVARLTASAKPVAEFIGMPPSGHGYEIDEIHIFRIANGRIAEHWHQMDAMSLMKQLKGDGQAH